MEQKKIVPINNKVLTYLYHDVSDYLDFSGFQTKGAQKYTHSKSEFRNYLNFFNSSKLKSKLVDDEDLRLTKDSFFLTFDDGGLSAMYIIDELERYNFKGHFFITTSMIGNKTFLDESQIREIKSRGHIVGSHSHSHRTPFSNLTYNEMIFEWKKSIDILSNILGFKPITASIPGGDKNFNSLLSAEKCGIKYLFNSEPSFYPKQIGQMVSLGRFSIDNTIKISQVKKIHSFKINYKIILIRYFKNLIKKIYYPLKKKFIEK